MRFAADRRPEVASDVISGENANTINGYTVLNFEVASFSSFQDIFKKHFVTAADIDDRIKRKHIRVSLRNCMQNNTLTAVQQRTINAQIQFF